MSVLIKKQRQEDTSGGRCPICKEPTAAACRPFCSARCRDVDLARWFSGSYAIPGSDVTSGAGGAAGRNGARDGDDEDEG
jgi:endogenous inhibitor of DNA gyrase (YacG/DUF329 family)